MPILLAYSHGVMYGGLACMAIACACLIRSIMRPVNTTYGHAKVHIDYDKDGY